MKRAVLGFLILITTFVFGVAFQNCAGAGGAAAVTPAPTLPNNPDNCTDCSDAKGTGRICSNSEGVSGGCQYESCSVGFRLSGHNCVEVPCTAGATANCPVDHGEGQMVCTEDGEGFGHCTAYNCETGYILSNGICEVVSTDPDPETDPDTGAPPPPPPAPAPAPAPAPTPAPPVDPGPGACVPGAITPCTIGAGSGFQTCNSAGTNFGNCEINGCQSGYTLSHGVCVVQVCNPGESANCEFDHGSGVKECDQSGSSWGPCHPVGCQPGYVLENESCHAQECAPGSTAVCQGESGSGTKTCNSSGMAYSPCILNSCDPGFELKNEICVRAKECQDGENIECTKHFGSGVRTCSEGKLGPCRLTDCIPGYVLAFEKNNPVCKRGR